MKNKVSLIVALLIVFFISTNCAKVQDEIIGTWTFHNFEIPDSPHITWTFTEDGDLIRMMERETEILFDSCNYIIEESIFRKQIRISGSEQLPERGALNGLYNVEKFKNDLLIITRIELEDGETGGAYFRCEFTRN